jgi:hypothetical protein
MKLACLATLVIVSSIGQSGWVFLCAADTDPSQQKSDDAKLAADSALFKVIDESGASHSVSNRELAALPRHTVKAKHNQTEMQFEGVSLSDLLQSLGVGFGEQLRGKRAATVAVCEATDGYRIVVGLLEIDPATSETLVLVADSSGGKPLGDKEGPVRLVIPDEKRPIRWLRMLRTIRVVNLNTLPFGEGTKAEPPQK